MIAAVMIAAHISAGSYAQATVPAFWLDREPVTNGEMLAFVTSHPEWRRDRVTPLFADTGYLARWASPTTLGPRAPVRAPVVEVSWFAARAFCAARGGRLPTEAEWERAASADGNEDLAWYEQPAPDVLRAIGGKQNALGVADLHGLVWEWVDDFGATGVDMRAGCGGGASADVDARAYAKFLRLAFRGSLEGPFTTTSLGFRCAYDEAPHPRVAPPSPARGDRASLYGLGIHVRGADGRAFGLDAARGQPVLVSMFYASCPSACPALVDELTRVLADARAANARVLLVSFDAARDTPARLAELAREHHLDARWTLAVASDPDARALAAVLGIKYRRLPDGEIAHDVAVVALDRDGQPIARMDRLGDHAALLAALAR